MQYWKYNEGQYRYFLDAVTDLRCRSGQRGKRFVEDAELVSGGFLLTENVGWENIDGAVTITAADFAGVDTSHLDDARQADGSLPIIGFGHLITGSDLIAACIGVGLTRDADSRMWYKSPAMGAYEYAYEYKRLINATGKALFSSTGKRLVVQ